MADKFEAKMKNIKSINDLQNSADGMEDLKAEFTESMNPVITLANSWFEEMKLKDEPVQSKNVASEEEIKQLIDSIYLIDNKIDFTKLTDAELKEKNDNTKIFRNYMVWKQQKMIVLAETETDKVNKELLLSQRVCSAIKCTNCLQPICIYAASKLNYNAFILSRRVKDEGPYVCGLDLFKMVPTKKNNSCPFISIL